MASEIIREKLMRFTGEELPYSVTVEIEQFKVNERGTYEINGLILVEREGQKKMVIGAQGQKLKPLVWKRELTWNAYLIIKYTLNFG